MPYNTILPQFILDHYEIHEWRHAAAVLSTDYPEEWAELLHALTTFRLYRREVEAPGGGRSAISIRLDNMFRTRGWAEREFITQFSVNGNVVEARGHKVDNYKNGIACDVEWNNKTEFFDRDLANFARLHAIGAVAAGIIITRATHLHALFNTLGLDPETRKPYGTKYGASTTHMDKLVPKVHGGAAGGCPVLVFGITRHLWADDVADPTLYSPNPDARTRWKIENPDLARAERRRRRPQPDVDADAGDVDAEVDEE